MNKKRLVYDLLLIIVLLAAGALVFLITEAVKDEGTLVAVTLDGEKIAEYSLSENGEYLLNGGTNILVISDGKAYITEADCPDRLCINQGKISRAGERIVCLPNRLMIEVLGGEDEIFSN